MTRPVAVAITGGIGAGKSEALQAFARRGAAVISADDIVHRLLRDDSELQAELHETFGVRISSGSAEERAALARSVFGERERVETLERILHPRVVEEQRRWLAALASTPDPPPLAAIEVPLLYETGAESRFDAVVVITAPAAVRAARKEGLVSLAERSERLLPDEEKAARADFVYVNDGTLDELDAFVSDVVAKLTRAG